MPLIPTVTGRAARIAALLVLVLASAGCRRKPEASPAFTQAHQLYRQLYAEHEDDAFLDPQMDEVERLLKEVPANSLDALAAADLAKTITEGRERAREAKDSREKAIASAAAPPPGFVSPGGPNVVEPPPEAAAAAAGAPDAGPPAHPSPGMTVAELSSRFGDCFQQGRQVFAANLGMRDTWELRDIARCRDTHPGFETVLLVADKGVIAAVGQRSAVERRELTDGGVGGRVAAPGAAPAPGQQPTPAAAPVPEKGIDYKSATPPGGKDQIQYDSAPPPPAAAPAPESPKPIQY